MSRFELEVAKRWVNTDGRTASVYGSCPYVSDADKANWTIVNVGYTIRDNRTNTVGMGRKPYESKYDAALIVTNLNTLVEQGKPAVINPAWLKG
jgi:hypothetical protein